MDAIKWHKTNHEHRSSCLICFYVCFLVSYMISQLYASIRLRSLAACCTKQAYNNNKKPHYKAILDVIKGCNTTHKRRSSCLIFLFFKRFSITCFFCCRCFLAKQREKSAVFSQLILYPFFFYSLFFWLTLYLRKKI